MSASAIIKHLKSLANPANVAGMARFGINPRNTLGISIPTLRDIAKKTGKNHTLALELWRSCIHEARILAALVDDPAAVTDDQLESWVEDFDSWDVCDQVCSNLFDRTPYAYRKAVEWSKRPEEFVRRAGFVLMAALAVHDKKAPDARFREFLPLIEQAANDERNYVKKAVNWALRQIGKRNAILHRKAIATARSIRKQDFKAARWIAADALRELEGEGVRNRFKRKTAKASLI